MPDDTEVNKKDLETPEPIIAKPKPVADEVLDKVSLKMEDPDQDPIDDDMEEPIVSKPPKSKKRLVIVGVVVLLVAAAIGAWFIFGKKEKADTPAQQENTSQVETTKGDTPIDIVYAHSDVPGEPTPIFKRPATGGDRVELNYEIPVSTYVDRFRDVYVFTANDDEIWVGSGDGAPVKVYTVDVENQDVVSPTLSSDGKKIVFGVAFSGEARGSNAELWTINLDGSEATKMFTGGEGDGGFFPLAYNGQTGTTYFLSGCYQCDGLAYIIWKYADGKAEQVVDINKKAVGSLVFNASATAFLYIEPTTYTTTEADSLGISTDGIGMPRGGPFGSPYKVHEYNLESKEDETVGTVGVKSPQTIYPEIAWSDDLDNQRPVYSDGARVFLQNDSGKFDNVYDAGEGSVSEIVWVTPREVIARVGKSTDPDDYFSQDTTVNYFNIGTKEAKVLLEATYMTTILAVTR